MSPKVTVEESQGTAALLTQASPLAERDRRKSSHIHVDTTSGNLLNQPETLHQYAEQQNQP